MPFEPEAADLRDPWERAELCWPRGMTDAERRFVVDRLRIYADGIESRRLELQRMSLEACLGDGRETLSLAVIDPIQARRGAEAKDRQVLEKMKAMAEEVRNRTWP